MQLIPQMGGIFRLRLAKGETLNIWGFLIEILYRLKIYKEVKKWQRLN